MKYEQLNIFDMNDSQIEIVEFNKVENVELYLEEFEILKFVESIKIRPKVWFYCRPGKDDYWGVDIDLVNKLDDFDSYILLFHGVYIMKKLVGLWEGSGWSSGHSKSWEIKKEGMYKEWGSAKKIQGEICNEILMNYSFWKHKNTLLNINNLSSKSLKLISVLLFTKVYNLCAKQSKDCDCQKNRSPHFLFEFISEIKLFDDDISKICLTNKIYNPRTSVNIQNKLDYIDLDKVETNELINNSFFLDALFKGVKNIKLRNLNLNGGILLSSSHYWQDDRDEVGDYIIRNWRNNHLDMQNAISVSLPIKYGKFIRKKEDGNSTYTMIFDKKLQPNQFGKLKAVPFKFQPQNWEELKREVVEFSKANGRGEKFLKGWGVCCIIFNPKIKTKQKNDILKDWKIELLDYDKGINGVSYFNFSLDTSVYSVSQNGELIIEWPKEASNFDYFITISSKPKLRDKNCPQSPEEIAMNINRKYFFENIDKGITTYQDEEIKDIIKKKL